MDYILALDQGTTSSRAIIFDGAGKPVASHASEFRQTFPQAGHVEHDAREIWQSQWSAAQKSLAQLAAVHGQAALGRIRAVGIANQRETTVLWDRATGEPICNAIVWPHRRTVSVCEAIRKSGKAHLIQQKTGLVLDAYFSATKLAWMLDNIPAARAKAARDELCFGTVDSWLIYKFAHTCGRGRLPAGTTRASVTTRLSILGADSPCNTPNLAAAGNSEFVRFAVQYEFARTVEDILAQR